ncbi:MAG: hypothetical protein KatS3mg124_0736 [Porticoccaceae bacterium]|nr:MAG: hypothetical protein KatS3mg124_0736 [Porticoccaceae bacterium]
MPRPLPFGAWPSPLAAEDAARAAVGRDFPRRAGDCLYWQESRPAEEGRTTVVERQPDGTLRDLLPPGVATRSRVHEYGGLSWLVAGDNLYYVEQSEQRLWRRPLAGGAPRPLTPAGSEWRFADLEWDPARRRILAVAERHRCEGAAPENCLVAVAIGGGEVAVLVAGADFYAYPRLSPDGRRLAFLRWNHPQMPWDGCELVLAALDDQGRVAGEVRVAGGAERVDLPAGLAPRRDPRLRL